MCKEVSNSIRQGPYRGCFQSTVAERGDVLAVKDPRNVTVATGGRLYCKACHFARHWVGIVFYSNLSSILFNSRHNWRSGLLRRSGPLIRQVLLLVKLWSGTDSTDSTDSNALATQLWLALSCTRCRAGVAPALQLLCRCCVAASAAAAAAAVSKGQGGRLDYHVKYTATVLRGRKGKKVGWPLSVGACVFACVSRFVCVYIHNSIVGWNESKFRVRRCFNCVALTVGVVLPALALVWGRTVCVRNALNSATVVTNGREGDSYFLEFKVPSIGSPLDRDREERRDKRESGEGGRERDELERDELDISSFRLNVRSTVQGHPTLRKRESVLTPSHTCHTLRWYPERQT